MQINSSLEWNDVHTQLRSRLANVPYNPDLTKMLRNISHTVSHLSSLEVEARRTNKYYIVEKQVNSINTAINHFEKLLLMAELMK
jgi:hypothetical protein